ncbi:Protein of unknown function [Amphibacillus marinus]|uniref:DUF1510 domain-containing protein n=1 Tax=Amphibacillus marinus TaxID=872970 RepID=A0A1H8NW82_9BACI|nr:YrrS family protein [Amphibacillus marinus]SEO33814.1 Protein of unknown function [Amphibacillus marinus]
MTNDESSYSRLNRFEKRRKNSKWLTIMISVGSVLIIIFIVILVLTGNGDEQAVVQDPNQEIADDLDEDPDDLPIDEPDNENDTGNDEPSADDPNNDPSTPNLNPDDYELEFIDPDETDSNIEFAYTSEWSPIPTEQSEPYEFSWDQSAQDWQEMMQAAELASGVSTDEMYYLWVSGNGTQSVIATFSNNTMDEHFRVYLTWIENQGWQPEHVDMLYRHDQMHRFQTEDDE